MIAMANEAIEDNQLATLFSCLTAYHRSTRSLRNFKVESVPSQNHQIREENRSFVISVVCFAFYAGVMVSRAESGPSGRDSESCVCACSSSLLRGVDDLTLRGRSQKQLKGRNHFLDDTKVSRIL